MESLNIEVESKAVTFYWRGQRARVAEQQCWGALEWNRPSSKVYKESL